METCKWGHPRTAENTYVSPKGHRRCRVCNLEAALKYRAVDLEAARERVRERYSAHPDKFLATNRAWRQRNPGYDRERWAKYKYGLSLVEYDAIIARGCAICGTHEGQICLDHDHSSGRVRDALCAGCNHMLGKARDDPQRLRDGAEYLEKHLASR